MYTRFDPVLRPVIRQTEESDPWFGIRRHERENGQRKKHHKEDSGKEDAEIDAAVLSVFALRTFLYQMLGKTAQPSMTVNPTKNATPAAYAAQAYQARAGAPASAPSSAEMSADTSEPMDLTSDEHAKIMELVAILDELEGRGIVEFPVITSKGSLLENITEAAKKASLN